MEEKQQNNNQVSSVSLVNTVLLLAGMMAIGFISLYIPVMIFALLIFAPFALDMDMKQAKPILSIGLFAVSAIFLYFTQYDFALYRILALSTGASAVLGYIVWRFLGINRFSDGLLYSVFSAVIFGILAALAIFLMRDRQPFAEEIVMALEKWMLQSDSFVVGYYYRYYLAATAETIGDAQAALMSVTKDITNTEMVNAFMPFLQSDINTASLSAMVLYPAFTGVITWWRGNTRFYKNQPMNENNKELKPKPFSTFTMPRWLFTSITFLLLLSFILMMSDYGEVMFNASVLMQNFAFIMLIIQGSAVIEYFLKRGAAFKNGALRVIVLVFIAIISSGLIPVFIGGIDMFVNVRLTYARAQAIKRQMEQNAQQQSKDNQKDNDDK